MTWRTRFLGMALGAMSAALMAQQATSAQSTTTTTTTTTVTGSVVQYSPGQTIVVRSADGKTTTYTLGPSVSVPADVSIGRSVTLSTQPGDKGAQPVVTRIEVKSANPADSSPSAPSAWSGSPSGASGQFSSSASSPSASAMASSDSSGASPVSAMSDQDASSGRPSSGAPSTSGQSSDVPPTSGLSSGTSQSETTQTTTTYSGKVTAYSPKQSITIDEPGKGTVTYVIDADSDLPQDVAIGKTVTITTRTVAGTSKPVVKTVTTTTTTRKTTEKQPQ